MEIHDEYRDVNMMVTELENLPRYTGILNRNGTKIYRIETREPIGFRIRSIK